MLHHLPNPRPRRAIAILLALMVIVTALAIGDKHTLLQCQRLTLLLTAAGALVFMPRTGEGWKRFLWGSVLLVLSVVGGLLLQTDSSQVFNAALHYGMPVIIFIPALLFASSPGFALFHRDQASRKNRSTGVLWLFALVCMTVISGFAGRFPQLTMEALTEEIFLYASLFMLMPLVLLQASPRAIRVTLISIGALLILVLISMTLIVASAAAGGYNAREALAGRGWIIVELEDPAAPWRILFPFTHHNRTAYFCVIACFASLTQLNRSATVRLGCIATAILSLVMLGFTATRGAAIGVAAGLVVMLVLAFASGLRWRWSYIPTFIAVLVALWLLLPPGHRDQFLQIASSHSYVPGPTTSIGARLAFWPHVMEMVRLHPFTGVGYGYESFERYAQGHYGDILATMSGLSHAHNTYLETAAESGILAAILLLGFTITRIIALMLQTFRVRKMRHPVGVAMVAWVGLEVALQVYGLSNYALRRNMGILTYGVWGISATMILYAASLTGREPSTPPNEINAEESIATPR
ncbi:hypothetical protein CVU37_08275 [candidate division BRC1 bacterium HGW-BRC1-1]|jgi:O-antigen ligase|nr:MAG: hypothetical protein CVU37_08275 [candidate division BRC1 bacterium HGW-BRC1-1]